MTLHPSLVVFGVSDVYAEDLRRIIQMKTGMYTRL